MSDTQRISILNSLSGVISSVVAILIGLISQRIFATTLGVEYLGVNGLFSNLVSMISIAELGLGVAIVYHLYKPVAYNEREEIKSLMRFYKLSYRFIAILVLLLGIALMPFIPIIVGETSVSGNLHTIFAFFIADSVLSYLLSYKRSLLYADQRNYLVNITHLIAIIIMNVMQIIVLLATKDYLLYLGIKIGSRIAENVALNSITNRRYPYLTEKKVKPINEDILADIFKKIRALFLHKIGTFIIAGTDAIIISLKLGVAVVGVYGNYMLIIVAVNSIVTQAFGNITSTIGNILVKNPERSYSAYKNIRFINFWLTTVSVVCFAAAINSFILVWLGSSSFLLGYSVVLSLAANMYNAQMRSSISIFKEAAGIFHEDRYIPILESGINIVASLVLIQFFGLAGVFMGTVLSSFVLHFYSYPKFVYTKLFNRSYLEYYKEFFGYVMIATTILIVTLLTTSLMPNLNYAINMLIHLAAALAISNGLLFVIFHKSNEFTYARDITSRILKKTGVIFMRLTRNPIAKIQS